MKLLFVMKLNRTAGVNFYFCILLFIQIFKKIFLKSKSIQIQIEQLYNLSSPDPYLYRYKQKQHGYRIYSRYQIIYVTNCCVEYPDQFQAASIYYTLSGAHYLRVQYTVVRAALNTRSIGLYLCAKAKELAWLAQCLIWRSLYKIVMV